MRDALSRGKASAMLAILSADDAVRASTSEGV